MEDKFIQGKSLIEWKRDYPLLNEIISTNEVFWFNPKNQRYNKAVRNISISEDNVKDAEERLIRFAPYIAKAFPETSKSKGIIESPIVEIPKMKGKVKKIFNRNIKGKLLIKCDNDLPIAGSIKARGGIYEVLKHAEDLAIKNGMLSLEDDYSIIDSEKFRNFFSKYSIAVGSTGNLGLSIGIISAKLGFNVTVHMSADAKEWKKNLLKSKGVNVVEHNSDYTKAVEEGRKEAASDPNSYFVDDENSLNLFLGYAVAAYRLKEQLDKMDIIVDDEHPLFVYLPCGVGGGPGGVTFGLKLVYGDNVHCFFAEPTHSPCMLIGMMTGLHDKVSVGDFGIDNITEADGLAVGRPSGFVGKTLENLLSGIYTVEDNELYRLLSLLIDTEDISLEPSALAGAYGPIKLFDEGYRYIENNNLKDKMENATHIIWSTGGSLVPKDIMKEYYKKGLSLL
ncbi:D-serine ammonia-lyase [Thermohalobacter berrensis]|uniref:Probable D-serine dehydratase n=1 Tax=Thermohalobacter berrensis TaxID=99594 RepID=A0A419SUD5_9FIRM|nr:D-serine ammonia-lyase [Thermohalobacter berrensis]RKD28772.1 D-serine ammonia-lyase [Thermohalobacter berrensis]